MSPFEQHQQYQALSADAIEAGKDASKASSIFNETQRAVNKEVVQGLQQISYVSAGTISLSITFLGYLLGQGEVVRSILQTPVMRSIPLLWILFISWAFLFVAITLGLLYRFINSWYLHAAAGFDWSKSNATAKEKMLQYVKAGFPIVFRETTSRDEGVAHLQESQENYLGFKKWFDKRKNLYLNLIYWSHRVVVGAFIIGMLLLFVFVVVTIQTISV